MDNLKTLSYDKFLSETFKIDWYKSNNLISNVNADSVLYDVSTLEKGCKVDISFSSSDYSLLYKFNKDGWYLGSSKLYFAFENYDRPKTSVVNRNVQIRSMEKRDTHKLITRAYEVFNLDRYRNDPELDKDLVKILYQRWLENNINTRCKEILIAETNSEAAGFLCVIEKENYYYFELIGVFPEWKGNGIGSALVQNAVSKYNEKKIEVITQFHNSAMQNVLIKNGFKIFNSEYILTKSI